MQQVVADSTDPVTTRPNLEPVLRTGSGFIPMDLPLFSSSVNLPPNIKPKDSWGLFLLFFPKDQMRIICDNTNARKDKEYQARFTAGEISRKARINDWKPMTLPEAYGYLGIRIYMGIHIEHKAQEYWKPGNISWPDHGLTAVMSLKRFEAIHTAFRLYTSDPEHQIEAVFDRVSPTSYALVFLLIYSIVRAFENSYSRNLTSIMDPWERYCRG